MKQTTNTTYKLSTIKKVTLIEDMYTLTASKYLDLVACSQTQGFLQSSWHTSSPQDELTAYAATSLAVN